MPLRASTAAPLFLLCSLATTDAWRATWTSRCSQSRAFGRKSPIAASCRLSAVRMEAADDDDLMAALRKKLEEDSDEQASTAEPLEDEEMSTPESAAEPIAAIPAPEPPAEPEVPKAKNAVDIENEKRALFLKQQKERAQRRERGEFDQELCAAEPPVEIPESSPTMRHTACDNACATAAAAAGNRSRSRPLRTSCRARPSPRLRLEWASSPLLASCTLCSGSSLPESAPAQDRNKQTSM